MSGYVNFPKEIARAINDALTADNVEFGAEYAIEITESEERQLVRLLELGKPVHMPEIQFKYSGAILTVEPGVASVCDYVGYKLFNSRWEFTTLSILIAIVYIPGEEQPITVTLLER